MPKDTFSAKFGNPKTMHQIKPYIDQLWKSLDLVHALEINFGHFIEATLFLTTLSEEDIYKFAYHAFDKYGVGVYDKEALIDLRDRLFKTEDGEDRIPVSSINMCLRLHPYRLAFSVYRRSWCVLSALHIPLWTWVGTQT